MDIKNRIKQFVASKNLSDKAFEKILGVSNGSWQKASTVSENVLLKFVDKFPEVSVDWLLTGEGDMIIAESSQVVSGVNNNQITGGQGSIVLDASNRLIDEMAAQRQLFSDLISEKDRQIDKLLQLLSKDK